MIYFGNDDIEKATYYCDPYFVLALVLLHSRSVSFCTNAGGGARFFKAMGVAYIIGISGNILFAYLFSAAGVVLQKKIHSLYTWHNHFIGRGAVAEAV
jgi:hypothetical protein